MSQNARSFLFGTSCRLINHASPLSSSLQRRPPRVDIKARAISGGGGVVGGRGRAAGDTTVAGVVVGLSWIWLAVRWGLIQGSATPRRVSIHPPLAHPLPAVARTDGRGGARLPRQSGSARIDWDLGRGDLEKARGKSWWTLWTDGNSET